MPIFADSKSERFDLRSWTVEPSTGSLYRDGETERLEPRVMSLLCLLASQPGRVFSKQELFDAVWGVPIVEDTTLARCISDLRRALGDDARNPRYIETIPKKGYRLIAGIEKAPPREKGESVSSANRKPRVLLWAGLAASVGLIFFVWHYSTRDGNKSPGDAPSLSAYDYYLQGGDHYKKYRRADNEKAIELFRLALEVDPDFALAHAGLANALALLGDERAEAMLEDATRVAEHYMTAGSEDVLLPWTVAVAAAAPGDREAALSHLEDAWQAGYRRWELDDPAFTSLRTIPRYQLLLQRNRNSLMEDRARLQESAEEPQYAVAARARIAVSE